MFNHFSTQFKIAAWLLLVLTFVGAIAAQEDSGKQPCDPAQLARQQAELAATLDSFKEDYQSKPETALDNLYKVGAGYQELAINCGYIPPDVATRFVGADVQRILKTLDQVTGDPLNGQLLYNSETLACYGCHVNSAGEVAPHLEGTLTRVEETRLNDPALQDYTVEQYLIESIVQPNHYVVPRYAPAMPGDFGQRLTLQDLADLLAYLESQDGPSPE